MDSSNHGSSDDNTNLVKKDKVEQKDVKEVEEEDYFHGFLPREDISSLLKDNGEFLVRVSEPKNGEARSYIISLCTSTEKKDFKHFVIIQSNNFYYVDTTDKFDTIPKLVEHYKSHKITVDGGTKLFLKKPIPRASWELSHEMVTLTKKLGEGAFGEVYKGNLSVPNRATVQVAVKTAKSDDMNKENIKDLMREARMMRHFIHPNIVRTYGVAVETEPLYIVMEFVPNGDLVSLLKANPDLPADERLKIVAGVAWGLEYLHSKNCIHRDIAARNCLMGKGNQPKISDFGLSREGTQYSMQTSRMLPIKWIAPETLTHNIFGPKTDVWSFGILAWEVYAGGIEPYPGMSNAETKEKVLKGYINTFPANTSPEVATLVSQQCWTKDPCQRAHMCEVARVLERLGNLSAPVVPPLGSCVQDQSRRKSKASVNTPVLMNQSKKMKKKTIVGRRKNTDDVNKKSRKE